MNKSMNFLDAILNGNEEAMHYAIYLYEKANKYKWHYLRKDSNDLQDILEQVLRKIQIETQDKYYEYINNVIGNNNS